MKRRISLLFLVLALVFSVVACSAEEKKVTLQEEAENSNLEVEKISILLNEVLTEESVDKETTCRVSWEEPKLSAEDAEKYPELTETFDAVNNAARGEAEKLMDELVTVANEMIGESSYPLYFSGETQILMQRADSDAVSYLEAGYMYSGGAHPIYYYHGKNYDTQSGEEIELSDVIADSSKLAEILAKRIEEKYSDVTFTSLRELLEEYSEADFSWTIDYQGITFWFSPYDIAPYAVGTLSAKIYFDEMPELFGGKYKEAVPDEYAVLLPLDLEIEFDLKQNDGERDGVCVGKTPDKTASYYMFTAEVNGAEYINEINYAYDFDAYLVHMKDKNYICYVSYTDDDYNMFYVLDINEGEIKQIYEKGGTQLGAEFLEEETDALYKEIAKHIPM